MSFILKVRPAPIISSIGRISRRNTSGTLKTSNLVEKAILPASSVDTLSPPTELVKLVDRICTLDLVQIAQLVSLLKKRLNLPDVVAAPAIMASLPDANSATQMGAPPAAPVVEKTEFRITLEKFDPTSKAKVIREIKALLPQLNLVEAKTFVESAPKLIKEKVKKEEAEKIKKTLEELGATITLD